jgi:lanosterol synthase
LDVQHSLLAPNSLKLNASLCGKHKKGGMNKFWDDWELITSAKGRQYWSYIGSNDSLIKVQDIAASFPFNKQENANSADLVYRYLATKGVDFSIPIEIPEPYKSSELIADTYTHVKKGINYYEKLITPNHFITGDYGGPMFLLPGLIIVSHITDSPLPISFQKAIIAYMRNQQNQDGGWGLHIESKSTMFGSCMNYTALRLLGEDPENEKMKQGRLWIQSNGGASLIPSWGKFYLSVLNVYEWEGNNSLFPEIWLLPKWLPFYPSKYWCHARMVYLPMAYCFGAKIKHPLCELSKALREELYTEDYKDINWAKARNACAESDVFRHSKPLLKVLNGLTNIYEKLAPKFLRKKALNFIIQYINAEDEQTNYINIGPVNQAINSLAIWHRYGKESKQFQAHVSHWKDYLWLAEDGMKMQGYNGAQFWETAFTLNAINESEVGQEYEESLSRLYKFLDISQIQEGIPLDKLFFRHPNEGGWPFSTVEHAWPITDCTADGIKTVINQHQFALKMKSTFTPSIDEGRLRQAVDLVLSFQGKDGGWSSYEKRRAPFWIEALNPSEIFGEIMVDYPYTECSSSSIQGLVKFRSAYPNYKTEEINKAIINGIQFIKNQQGEDGSWYGSWGVCYTYAAWFGLEALACGDEYYENSENVKLACDFLVSKQQSDGSWGESYESCVKLEYVQHEKGQIINTAWSLLGLMIANYPNQDVIDRAIRFLNGRQEENGDFPQESISGVFNKNCMETYTSYRNVFPIWALNRYLRKY